MQVYFCNLPILCYNAQRNPIDGIHNLHIERKEKIMKSGKILRILLACGSALFISACGKDSGSDHAEPSVQPTPYDLTETIAPDEQIDFIDLSKATPTPTPTPEPVRVSLMMVGDNLLHTGILNTGKQADGSYNFDFEFQDIKEFIDAADIAIINQETPIGGDDRPFTSYPTFNSPTAVADAEAKAGFNVVLGATNHAYDQGYSGLIHFADYYHNAHPEILLCGIHGSETPDPDKNPRIYLLEMKGYTFAFINATYSHNWESVAADAIGHLDFLCPYDNSRKLDMTKVSDQVLEDIREADTLADMVIVCPHWGVEYTFTPMPYQTTMAQQMIDAGADLIIGAHPHVVEPVEWITTDSGNTALCYYSLGNYTSTQDYPERVYEAMAWVCFEDPMDGSGLHIVKEKSGALSLINHYSYGPMLFEHVYLLEDYSEELCLRHGLVARTGRTPHMSDFQKWELQLLGEYALKRSDVLGNPSSEEAPVKE